ncbi:MAG: glycosyltransferase [Flavobacteriaceae bacterium]|nr:glycosyltransferase [Flavobacteriaceae bacterium]
MKVSILIVTKNRKVELEQTLEILENLINKKIHEVLVFIDGSSDNTLELINKFNWVKWESSTISLGASRARNELYKKALGDIFIGLDDDAHPLTKNFISEAENIFKKDSNIGIIAFQEIKGIYQSDKDALRAANIVQEEYYCSDFIGCGFAISQKAYNSIRGFPVWIDIYGEESCVSIEVLSKDFDIIYSNKIKINHRVDIEARRLVGMNYFRFGKQLKNITFYYIVYFPFPLVKILKLYWHNFRKYALSDFIFFKIFFKTILEVLHKLPKVIKYRKPVSNSLIKKMNKLQAIKY